LNLTLWFQNDKRIVPNKRERCNKCSRYKNLVPKWVEDSKIGRLAKNLHGEFRGVR
jgi:hypothetical protein